MAQQAPVFSTGGDSAQAADEAARAAHGGSFRKTHYFPDPGPGKSVVVRYLTDSPSWIHADAHPSAPTKNQPEWWPKERKWPESMPAVCRYDDAFQFSITYGPNGEKIKTPLVPPIHSDCYICDAKLTNNWGRVCNPVVRVWALAVLREEVIGTQELVDAGAITADKIGKRVGYRDATREVKVTGPDGKDALGSDGQPQTERELAIIVVNKPVSNFFAGLQSAYDAYGSVCDKDFIVKQNGEKKDVDFVHMPLTETPKLKPGTEKWAKYTEAIEAQGSSVDLQAMLVDRANDEFYALFFDPTKVAVERKKKDADGNEVSATAGGAPASQQATAASAEPDADRLAAMRDRLRGGGAAPEAAPAAEAPAAPAEPAQAPPAAPEPTPEPVAAAAGAASVDFD